MKKEVFMPSFKTFTACVMSAASLLIATEARTLKRMKKMKSSDSASDE